MRGVGGVGGVSCYWGVGFWGSYRLDHCTFWGMISRKSNCNCGIATKQ